MEYEHIDLNRHADIVRRFLCIVLIRLVDSPRCCQECIDRNCQPHIGLRPGRCRNEATRLSTHMGKTFTLHQKWNKKTINIHQVMKLIIYVPQFVALRWLIHYHWTTAALIFKKRNEFNRTGFPIFPSTIKVFHRIASCLNEVKSISFIPEFKICYFFFCETESSSLAFVNT